jgi:hypothetical protein
LPVGGGVEAGAVGELQGPDEAEDLVNVAAGGEGVVEHAPEDAVGVYDEDGPDGGGLAGGGMDHPVEPGDLHVQVGDDGEVNGDPRHLLQVLHPG